jgi:hypothetical protein
MPSTAETFVSALVEQFGERADRVAREQAKRATDEGSKDIAATWTEIVDALAERRRASVVIRYPSDAPSVSHER